MSSAIGLQNFLRNLNKSTYEEVSELPLMSTLGPVFTMLVLYLAFVLKIGPNFMKKRKAFELKTSLLLYNIFQVVISAYMVYHNLKGLISMGLIPTKCYMDEEKYRKEILYGIWMYSMSKIAELFDTVFFILRKKDSQVTFLHVYHHAFMLIFTWAVLKYWPSQGIVFICFINSLVHVFMYTYYGLSALGPAVAKYLKWKKYMTTFQLIQFAAVLVHHIVSHIVSDCAPNKAVTAIIAGNAIFFALLFANFYRQSYTKKRPNSIVQENGSTAEAKEAGKIE